MQEAQSYVKTGVDAIETALRMLYLYGLMD
jgi:hypothetical protein